MALRIANLRCSGDYLFVSFLFCFISFLKEMNRRGKKFPLLLFFSVTYGQASRQLDWLKLQNQNPMNMNHVVVTHKLSLHSLLPFCCTHKERFRYETLLVCGIVGACWLQHCGADAKLCYTPRKLRLLLQRVVQRIAQGTREDYTENSVAITTPQKQLRTPVEEKSYH